MGMHMHETLRHSRRDGSGLVSRKIEPQNPATPISTTSPSRGKQWSALLLLFSCVLTSLVCTSFRFIGVTNMDNLQTFGTGGSILTRPLMKDHITFPGHRE